MEIKDRKNWYSGLSAELKKMQVGEVKTYPDKMTMSIRSCAQNVQLRNRPMRFATVCYKERGTIEIRRIS